MNSETGSEATGTPLKSYFIAERHIASVYIASRELRFRPLRTKSPLCAECGFLNPEKIGRVNRPGYRGGSNSREDGAMKKTSRYSPEVRERAVRMVFNSVSSMARSGRRLLRSRRRSVAGQPQVSRYQSEVGLSTVSRAKPDGASQRQEASLRPAPTPCGSRYAQRRVESRFCQ